jgi:hypothetical protein
LNEVIGNDGPSEHTGSDDGKVLLSAPLALLSSSIDRVEGVEERSVDQGSGPDHGRRPDQELSVKTTQAEPDHLGRDDQEKLVTVVPPLVVEESLNGDDVGSVSRTRGN